MGDRTPSQYDFDLAKALEEDALQILDATGDSKPRDQARATRAAELADRLESGEATEEDRQEALEHLHAANKRTFENAHPDA